MNMYAITGTGFRTIASTSELEQGETASDTIPESLLVTIEGEEIRARRDATLRSCDWTVGADAPLTADQVAAWKTYRQALRDLPTQSGFPATVEWPVPPST